MVCLAAYCEDSDLAFEVRKAGYRVVYQPLSKVIHFEDYNPDELAQIFRMKVKKDKLTLTPEAENAMRVYFTDLYNRRERNFANAREVNNYFDRVKKNQSSRLRHEMERPDFDPASYSILLPEDMG